MPTGIRGRMSWEEWGRELGECVEEEEIEFERE